MDVLEQELAEQDYLIERANDVLEALEKWRNLDLMSFYSRRGRAKGLIVLTSHQTNSHGKTIVSLAANNRLPAIYGISSYVFVGGLMSYGTCLPALNRRAAYYVDRILKGAKPADLPVERPMKFEFINNLNAAKQIGLPISPQVLARADRVIK